jgi:hypothetical protein
MFGGVFALAILLGFSFLLLDLGDDGAARSGQGDGDGDQGDGGQGDGGDGPAPEGEVIALDSFMQVEAGDGPDTITGAGVEGARVDAGGGDDLVEVEAQDSLFRGGAGDDRLFVEGGGNLLEGGDGDDRLEADFSTLVGGEGNDTLAGLESAFDGGEGDDRILAASYGKPIDGGGGDDLIDASQSLLADVTGGAGDDTIVIGGGNPEASTADGGAGGDRLVVQIPDTGLYRLGFGTSTGLTGGAGVDVFELQLTASPVDQPVEDTRYGPPLAVIEDFDSATEVLQVTTNLSGAGPGAVLRGFSLTEDPNAGTTLALTYEDAQDGSMMTYEVLLRGALGVMEDAIVFENAETAAPTASAVA